MLFLSFQILVAVKLTHARISLHFCGKFEYNKTVLHTSDKESKTNTVTNKKIRIAIFASGAGSNAKKIIERFSQHQNIEVALIVCNKPQAGVLNIAASNNIPVLLIEREKFFKGDAYIPELSTYDISFIVLAGFLWKIPSALIKVFPDKIINIHPALLPKYGGKGMFGAFVHEAVIAAKEKESGITIHFVDELYDHGHPIFQATCPVYDNDTPGSLAQRIHELEHKHFPAVTEKVIMDKFWG